MARVFGRWLPVPAVLVLAAGLSGCSPRTGSVAGSVQYNGRPVDGGQVEFMPSGGQPKVAVIQPDGTYSVAGVPTGDALVVVLKVPPGGNGRGERAADTDDRAKGAEKSKGPPRASLLPDKYAIVSTSPLRFNVAPGGNKYDITLTD